MAANVQSTHLIGAYGLFWDRTAVDWSPGPGKQWQLLGSRGQRRPNLRVCDFRKGRGIYILFNDYGATYVGLARGQQGFGQRLQAHTLPPRKQPKEMRHAPKDWSRFCWFAFDDVLPCDDPSENPWTELDLASENSRDITVDSAVRELEALMIAVLGIKDQNQMKPLEGVRWNQLTTDDCFPGGILTRVERRLVTTPTLAHALDELAPLT